MFYLREIHGHWTASNVSAEKLAELAEAHLIEVQPGGSTVVRLTHAGRRCKLAGRSTFKTTLSTSRLPALTRAPRRRLMRSPAKLPKPLV